ncbi:MAG: glycosyltransferase [Melioribacteraceae bacterium]|nr:glycosyltransferase [Melioribacteraceae bacterium]
MKFSIIIPTLNEENLLPNLLGQIVSDKLKAKYDYEIIVSDGGSNDYTVEYALKYCDKVVVHKEKCKQNISEGRNKGAEVAEGEWLIFLNGDVIISDVDLFFRLLTELSSDNKYAGITLKVDVEDKEKTMSDKIFLTFYDYYFHFLNIVGVGMGRGECLILSKNSFKELNGFNSNLAAGEDFDLFKRLRRKGKIYYSHKLCVYESPRRYRKYGHLKIFFTWLANSIFVIFKNKSLSKEWEEVR